MEKIDSLFEIEVQRTLKWASRHPKEWDRIVQGEELKPQELIDILNMLIDEKLYSLLIMFITGDFIDYYGQQFMRKILVEVLLSQWSENTLDIVLKVIKQTICEYSENREHLKGHL